ncbi:MAG: Amuc_1099 family pilus-like system protein [Candidatus Methylacidiphilales bacterium]
MKPLFQLRPEQWLLFGVFLFLGLVSLVKALFLEDVSSNVAGGKQGEPPQFDLVKVHSLVEQWNKSPSLSISDHQIFVSRLIVYQPQTGVIGYLAPEDTGPDKIRIDWKIKYGFPLDDPTIASADTDGDGFSNFEEFKAGTSPVDKADHPDLILKLCVKSYEYVPFRLIFRGYSPNISGTGLVYQINLLDVKQRNTRLVEEGQDLEGYKVGSFEKKIVKEFDEVIGIEVDRDKSELRIINPALEEPVVLVFNKETESDESRVVLQLNVPNESPAPAKLKRGETFKIRNKEYRLLSVSKDGAQVKDMANDQVIQIPNCN